MTRVIPLFVVVALVGVVWIPASAQLPTDFPENHYLVWNLQDQTTVTRSLELTDQFGFYTAFEFIQEKWGNPLLEKNGLDVMWNPNLHHSWYRLVPPLPNPTKVVTAIHQFGAFNLVLNEAIYLINPADKNNQIPGVPEANHYLCYIAEGQTLQRDISFADQWGFWLSEIFEPYCFCNPVTKKRLPDGDTYFPVDYDMHLTCYWVLPIQESHTFSFEDQFGLWDNVAVDQCLLCLPSLKEYPVKTEDSTWGRIKSLYRD